MLECFYTKDGKLTHKLEKVSGVVFRGLLAQHLHDVTWRLTEDGLLEARVFMRHPDRGTGDDCMMHQSIQWISESSLDPLAVPKAIQEVCLKAWMHEFHEGIWIDGQPLTDPHPEIPYESCAHTAM